jgi:mannan endo-1,4-beta-mannosidase
VKRALFVGLILLLVVAVAAVVFTQTRNGSHRSGPRLPDHGLLLFGRVNLNGTTTEVQDFRAREVEIGRKFDGFMTYVTSRPDFTPVDTILGAEDPPYIILSWARGTFPATVIPDIDRGAYDDDFRTMAQQVKARAPTVFIIRLFWEFNYTGAEWNDTKYGGNAQPFIDAWRRVVGIFRAQHVQNVLWDWNPVRVASSLSQDPAPYYPGNDYVDIIGLDAYPRNTQASCYQLATTGDNGNDWYAEYSKSSYGKPLMFGEIGVQAEDAYPPPRVDRPTWWHECLRSLQEKLTEIRAFTYFDSQAAPDKPDWHTDAPGKLPNDSADDAFAAYRAFAQTPYVDTLDR